MSELRNSTYLFGHNAVFVEELYQKYINNPQSVSEEWRNYFATFSGDSKAQADKLVDGPTWHTRGVTITKVKEEVIVDQKQKSGQAQVNSDHLTYYKVIRMIDKIRCKGHQVARLDPLGIEQIKTLSDAQLEPKNFDINDQEFNSTIDLKNYIDGVGKVKVNDLYNNLIASYCTTYSAEISHLRNDNEKQWLYNKLENQSFHSQITNEIRTQIFKNISDVEAFEQFLHVKFPGAKRFSVEGGEASVMSTEQIIEKSAEMGVNRVVLGMAHRGRLNTLTRILAKPYVSMISEFQGNLAYPENLDVSGDVKYHLGFTSHKKTLCGKEISLSMVPNPSHLEAVNPVVMGKVRAEQDQLQDDDKYKVLGLLIHGDAAVMGQGVVAESFIISEAEGYRVQGTVHIIVNNQVGFTANSWDARQSRYPSEFAKIIAAPIFHVNGDDVEAVAKVSRLAAEYRNTFKKDAVINIVCYRLHGHNETDEPVFTQPVMYKAISNHESSASQYVKYLVKNNIVDQAYIDKHKSEFKSFLEKELEASKSYKPNKADWLEGKWSKCKPFNHSSYKEPITGIDENVFKKIGEALTKYPDGFEVNPKVLKQLEQKKKMFESSSGFDWSTAEALAYASLVNEKFDVRLSGQDSGRGTFSHRHSVLHDQKSYNEYVPLKNISADQGKFYVYDSCLSEYAVMGFDYGYSITHPNVLVIWEGQFGDFSNGAQIVIDQYISSGETKWLRMSSLVLLLPHGFEGQGPEHSSARLERYLQLCADNNMQVVNCTTPASFFHVIRRQLHRDFRKPLIVMSPKSLLRHKLVTSKMSDFVGNTSFNPVISEIDNIDPSKVKKVVFCSGKIYYELYEHRQKSNIDNVAIIRLEQMYPFPSARVKEELAKYKNAEVIWCQEEPKNMAAYFFVAPLFDEITGNKIKYIGRKSSASPATGYAKIHSKEQAAIINAVFDTK